MAITTNQLLVILGLFLSILFAVSGGTFYIGRVVKLQEDDKELNNKLNNCKDEIVNLKIEYYIIYMIQLINLSRHKILLI